jgi:hypothetical protein
MHATDIASGVTITIPSFMKIRVSVHAILRFVLRNVRACSICIADGRSSVNSFVEMGPGGLIFPF